jgi:RES domain-containing protein
MIMLYRFAHEKYANDLSGTGAKLFGGRWNSKGLPALYTSSAISLSLLEILVYSASYEEITTNWLMKLSIHEKAYSLLELKKLKADWAMDIDYTRFIGDEFLKSKSHLLLKIPSAIIPDEYNYLVNPMHEMYSKLNIKSAAKFKFDGRLFKD